MARSSTSVECPGCLAKVRAVARPDKATKGRCPRCGAVMLIPAGGTTADESPSEPSATSVPVAALLDPGAATVPHRGSVTTFLWGAFAAVSLVGLMGGVWFLARATVPRDDAKPGDRVAINDPSRANDAADGGTSIGTGTPTSTGSNDGSDDASNDGATRGGKSERKPHPSTGRPGELGERYALLIGVREYDEEATGLRALQYTEDDVEELATVLKSAGYRPHNITVMTQTRGVQKLRFLPERERIVEQLEKLVEGRGPQDTVVVAFAGHGVQFKGHDDSFFCPLGTKLDDRDTLISYATVYEKLRSSEAGFSLLLSDACRNEALAPGARRATVDVESVTRPLSAEAMRGVAAFYGCAPGEVAFEDKSLKHGVFFHHVIQGLKGDADLFHDGEVTLDELVAYTRKHVPDFVQSKFESKQTPHLVGDVKGQLVLARVTVQERPPTPPAAPPPEPPAPSDSGSKVASSSPPKVPPNPPVAPPPVAPPPSSKPTGNAPTTGVASTETTGIPSPGNPPTPAAPALTVAQLEAAMAEKNRIPPGNYPAQVALPDCKGQTIARARQLLHAVGLGLKVASPYARDEDVVRMQSETAKKMVPSGTVVTLGMIHGRVPNLVGMTYAEAKRAMETEGFKLASGLSLDSPLRITHQEPEAGALRARNSMITVSHMMKLPDLAGTDLATARQRFAELGFNVKVETAFQPGDTVYSQLPRGDRLVAFGVPVKLTAGFPAPNLLGPAARAETIVIQLGINTRLVNRTIVATDDPVAANTPPQVTHQSIVPGNIMPRGGTIGVTVVQYAYVQKTN